MKTKTVQVFLMGDQTPEMCGELVGKVRLSDGCATVTITEGNENFTTIFPLNNLRMIRLYDEAGE